MDKDNFMIECEEMMSCCLTNETHQTAPRLAPDEERNCRVGGWRPESSENYNVHSLRNGHVEALCKVEYIVMNASHDRWTVLIELIWWNLVEHATTVPAGIWAV